MFTSMSRERLRHGNWIGGLNVASIRTPRYVYAPTGVSEEAITMRADEIVIISLAALDVLICWAIYELMTGRLTHVLAG